MLEKNKAILITNPSDTPTQTEKNPDRCVWSEKKRREQSPDMSKTTPCIIYFTVSPLPPPRTAKLHMAATARFSISAADAMAESGDRGGTIARLCHGDHCNLLKEGGCGDHFLERVSRERR